MTPIPDHLYHQWWCLNEMMTATQDMWLGAIAVSKIENGVC